MGFQGEEVAENIKLWIDIVTRRSKKKRNADFFYKVKEPLK